MANNSVAEFERALGVPRSPLALAFVRRQCAPLAKAPGTPVIIPSLNPAAGREARRPCWPFGLKNRAPAGGRRPPFYSRITGKLANGRRPAVEPGHHDARFAGKFTHTGNCQCEHSGQPEGTRTQATCRKRRGI